jgi:phosphoribosylformylglycinamidine cyclo-ligase
MAEASGAYDQRGVSAGKAEVHRAISKLDKGLYPNAFCKILPDLAGEPDWCSIVHADTAGTKAALAYLYWRETGDLSVWRGIAQDAIVMNLDDMGCAGALDQFVVSNTIGRNKRLVPGEVLSALIEGTAEVLEELTSLGINITLAGGETADVGDLVRTVDVGFTAVARLKHNAVKTIDIKPGAVVVGILSDGQAPWERAPNSGIGSNGLTYARHEVLAASYGTQYPESYDPGLDPSVVYTGSARLTDATEVPGLDVGRLLLSPTRTHLPLLRALGPELWKRIQGVIHTTGGGQTQVLHFLSSGRVVKDKLPQPPAVFKLIQSQRDADWRELYTVFNMGIRLELYMDDAATASEVAAIAASLGLRAQVTGTVEPSPTAEVVLTNPKTGEQYTYSK